MINRISTNRLLDSFIVRVIARLIEKFTDGVPSEKGRENAAL